jgi:hypothetical protein
MLLFLVSDVDDGLTRGTQLLYHDEEMMYVSYFELLNVILSYSGSKGFGTIQSQSARRDR